ncbi:bifunctional UDP-sugar hydrolase/5'-nucleotidase [Fervidobacterium nodosum]|uniref:5'-Nucleotidase domain protein n=1 Tax=Fervidobacterium nodosum (strain ATCC 35602 / DSM 5306 / Rt17-B1) TaxID=381764 RepID=A7HKR1_FERNB|nr:bifunctional UDP-sugar hydrolase/5'-nucleotidase [Fervidobacterium nodosum]ABS60494.1 5'-Nucleotidase domain protein [Fervidobacterium nodosum Rt17-B1]PHJ14455.1 metallophosphatase [Fervidobacterium sp. SC_NGM5_G05]
MKKFLIVLLLVLLSLFAFAVKITVFHINDTHGHAWSFTDSAGNIIGGFATVASIIDAERSVNPNVIFLHAGDINTGVPESDLMNAIPDIFALNRMRLAAATVGNHEFDKPRDVLMKQISWAKFPFLSANIYKDGKPLFTPYIIKEVGGVKVAIVGFTTEHTKILEGPNSEDLEFKNVIEVAKQLIPELKKQANVVIALTHLGVGQGYSELYTTADQLAKEVEGIDLIIDGHSHTQMTQPMVVNGVPIVQAFEWAKVLGRADIEVENGKVVKIDWQAIPVIQSKVVGKDESGKNIYQVVTKEALYVKTPLDYFKKLGGAKLDTVIGTTEILLDGERANVRSKTTNLANLIADSMIWKTGADVALTNGGGIRASIKQGNITIRDVLTVLPFGNTLYVLEMKGSDLIKVFEYAATVPNGQGAFLQVAGATWKSESGKLTEVLVGGKPIDPEKVYKVVTNDYMAAGGDGYSMLKGQKGYNTFYVMADVVVEYIQKALGGKITSYDDKPRVERK